MYFDYNSLTSLATRTPLEDVDTSVTGALVTYAGNVAEGAMAVLNLRPRPM